MLKINIFFMVEITTLLFLIGRILVGAFYIFNGIGHFARYKQMVEYAKSKGVIYPKLLVPLTGILLIFGGLSIITGFLYVYGILALLIFLVPTTIIMHNFWSIKNEQIKIIEMVNFMKNLALIGSLLMFLAIPSPWEFSLSF